MRSVFRLAQRGTARCAVVVLASVAGCETPLGPLCDGSDEIRLDARSMPGYGGGAVDAFVGSEGAHRLRVSGRCEYWVNDRAWFTQHGTLSDADAERISEALSYTELGAYEGRWPSSSCPDGGTVELKAQGHTVKCLCGCTREEVPPAVRGLSARFHALIEALAAEGETWDGPARVLVVQEDTLEDQDPLEWDLETPIAEIETPRSELSGSSEPPEGTDLGEDETAQLRAMMRSYMGEFPSRSGLSSPLPVIDAGQTYGVYVRDLYGDFGE